MTRTRIAALAGALTLAAALTGAGWLGYQQWSDTPTRSEALTTYDPDDPAVVSQTADAVFTATVFDADDNRRINGVDWNIYKAIETTPEQAIRLGLTCHQAKGRE
ncbi:hypothetical protein ABT127_28045 [Streptomyces sp. NPDC001904]|uniref:hypothetical protein n=1 Tax=Streptomyces sp. NPDC001904 TaxID=3154531 RepID=UPI00333488FB